MPPLQSVLAPKSSYLPLFLAGADFGIAEKGPDIEKLFQIFTAASRSRMLGAWACVPTERCRLRLPIRPSHFNVMRTVAGHFQEQVRRVTLTAYLLCGPRRSFHLHFVPNLELYL